MLTVVSCARQEQTETVRHAMDQKSETDRVSVPSLVPPEPVARLLQGLKPEFVGLNAGGIEGTTLECE